MEGEKPAVICNVEAEAALIGGMMMDNDQIERVAGIVKVEDFSDPLLGRVFKTICYLRNTGEAANPVTLQDYFADEKTVEYRSPTDGKLQTFHLIQFLISLCAPVLMLNVVSMAEQVRMLATMRRAAERADEMIHSLRSLSYDDDMTVEQVVSSAAASLLSEIEHISAVKVQRASTIMGKVRERQNRTLNSGAAGLECRHLPELTDLLGPLEPEQMTILAGRPGMGKSLVAQSIAWGVARNGHPTMFISEELGEEALGMRLAADITHAMGEPVAFRDIIRGSLTHNDLLTIDAAAEKVDGLPLYMVAPKNRSIDEMEARIAQTNAALRRKGQKLALVIVDYLQLLKVAGKSRMDPREIVNHISSRLIDIAKRYSCHVIALSQLNRAVDARDDGRPKLSDLKESGKLEEDASNVLFVYREAYYVQRNLPKKNDPVAHEEWRADLERCQTRLDLICAKSRANDAGEREVRFFGGSQAIRSANWRPLEMGEMTDMI